MKRIYCTVGGACLQHLRALAVGTRTLYFNVDEFLANELAKLYNEKPETFLTGKYGVHSYASIVHLKKGLDACVRGTWAKKVLHLAGRTELHRIVLDGALQSDVDVLREEAPFVVIVVDSAAAFEEALKQ